MANVGRRAGTVLVLGLMSWAAAAADLKVPLRFQPQEAVANAGMPSLPPSVLDKPISIAVVDGRGSSSLRIGQGTDDDDATFQILAEQPVAGFVQNVVDAVAAENGIRPSAGAATALKLRITRFHIDESNKAMGSMYAGEVKLAYTLQRANGTPLMEGAAEGSARRYGKSTSAENIGEVLSDATKEAIAAVFSDARLQTSWQTGVAAAPGVRGGDSIETKLARLDGLLKSGSISPAEHKQARADALKDP